MGVWFSLFAVGMLVLVASFGVGVTGLKSLFGIAIPYGAFVVFVAGSIWRIVVWARSPVPFSIATTSGQQKSFRWMKRNSFDNPSSGWGVVGRILLEVLFFRSLFRNTRFEFRDGLGLIYTKTRWLWLTGLTFHWSLLIVVIRHLRFFTEPVPLFVSFFEHMDRVVEIGAPTLYITDAVLLVSLTCLFLRRVLIPRIKYISIAADYFPLCLILGIILSGFFMRYLSRGDIVKVKELVLGLFTFHPVIPQEISLALYIHLFLVCVLLIYFPFSKLMHMVGLFFSPTINLAGNTRLRRHSNPWNAPVKLRSYEEYEDEFREKMRTAGLPLDKE